MKNEKRHISIEVKLIFGIAIAILVLVCSICIFNTYASTLFTPTKIPGVIVGAFILLICFLSFFATCCLTGCLIGEIWSKYCEKKSYLRSKKQIKTLPSNFVNVQFKDFDDFHLASFVEGEDITCFAKLDENGNVVYILQLNVEYETNDYETFLRNFDI